MHPTPLPTGAPTAGRRPHRPGPTAQARLPAPSGSTCLWASPSVPPPSASSQRCAHSHRPPASPDRPLTPGERLHFPGLGGETGGTRPQRARGPGATALGSYRGCRTRARALTLGRRPHRLRAGLRGGRASRDARPEGSALRLATGRGASATAGDTRSLLVLPQARARPRPGPGRHRRSRGRGQQPRSHVPPQRPPALPFSRLRPAAVLGQALVTTLCPLVPHWL